VKKLRDLAFYFLIGCALAYAIAIWHHDIAETFSAAPHLCTNGAIEHALNGCELPQ
jgi:hypothetical protein